MSNTTHRIAVLVADLYEDVELFYPYYRLLEAGHDVELVGCERDSEHTGKQGTKVTTTASAHDQGSYDAVIVPGGFSPDHMRRCEPMIDLVGEVAGTNGLVASICHGPWVLASAGLLSGRRVTSFHSIKDDLVNAGADWVDEETVVDGNVITARDPDDLPAFMRAVVSALDEQEPAA